MEFVVVNEIKKVSPGLDQSQIFIQEKTDNMQVLTIMKSLLFCTGGHRSQEVDWDLELSRTALPGVRGGTLECGHKD